MRTKSITKNILHALVRNIKYLYRQEAEAADLIVLITAFDLDYPKTIEQ